MTLLQLFLHDLGVDQTLVTISSVGAQKVILAQPGAGEPLQTASNLSYGAM